MEGQKIPVYDPRISVVLKKNVGRDTLGGSVPASARFTGVEREIDLTPFLSDQGGVATTKSTRQPAGGFTVTLADRMYVGTTKQMESLYGLIEPMDVVEIRFAHSPTGKGFAASYQALEKGLPVIMRGFVTNILRSEVMGRDGKPKRTIQISGQDYGKLWQIMQIKYLSNYVVGQQLLSFLKFAQNYGVQAVDMTPNEFIYECVSQIMNGFIADMRRGGDVTAEEDNTSPVSAFSRFELMVPDAKISPFGVNAFGGGSVYQLLTHYGDVGPFNELFLRDDDDGVTVVYRPNPFKRGDGEWVQAPGAVYAPDTGTATDGSLRVVEITDADIVGQQVQRSDAGIANYYWVNNPTYQLVSASVQQQIGANSDAESYYLTDYRNAAPWLYGMRIMEVQSQQGARFDGQREAGIISGTNDMAAWLEARRKVLIDTNKDNVIFESGSMSLRGNERIRAGDYLSVTRGNLTYEVYVTQVDHSYIPFQAFTTRVQFERGTSFIQRAQRGTGKQSPYLDELNGGGAYGADQ